MLWNEKGTSEMNSYLALTSTDYQTTTKTQFMVIFKIVQGIFKNKKKKINKNNSYA